MSTKISQYIPNETERQFIQAFTSLKESLITEVIEKNEPFDKHMWNVYHEIDALIERLYAGKEEIIYSQDKEKIEIIS